MWLVIWGISCTQSVGSWVAETGDCYNTLPFLKFSCMFGFPIFWGEGIVMLHETQALCACDLEYCEKLHLTMTVFSYFSVVYPKAQPQNH